MRKTFGAKEKNKHSKENACFALLLFIDINRVDNRIDNGIDARKK